MNSVPNHNMVIECGNFNAHLGKEEASYTYHEKTNINGKLLLEHINASNLLVTDTNYILLPVSEMITV